MEFFKSHKVYDFMRVRKYWIFLSIALALGSFVLLYIPGPNYGTDFRGGTEIEVAFERADRTIPERPEARAHQGQGWMERQHRHLRWWRMRPARPRRK